MSDAEILNAVKHALAKVAKIDPAKIDGNTCFEEDLGLDSLAILETIADLEFRFKIINVNVEEYALVRSVDAAVRFIQSHLCVVAR